jgi:hypothetical protein
MNYTICRKCHNEKRATTSEYCDGCYWDETHEPQTIHQFSEDNVFISADEKLIILDSGSQKIFVERKQLPELIKKLTDIQNG